MKVHMIDLLFQGQPQAIAAFLVEGPDGLALVETGPESTLDTLLAGIEAAGFSPAEVGDVFVTHIHLDHAGAAGWWAANHGANVHVHPRGARHLVNPSRLLESATMVYGELMDSLWGSMTPAPEAKTNAVEDGGRVRAAGLEFEAIDTPGHARHHHVWAVAGEAFVGDVAGARLPGSDFLSVTSAPPQFDLPAYEESIDRLLRCDFDRMHLTHFGTVENVEEHLTAYRREVRAAAEFVRDRMAEGGGAPDAIDAGALQVIYQAWNLERAFQGNLPNSVFRQYELANPSSMCADGLRLYWEKVAKMKEVEAG
jgi:glyoxylase-like metal-dependent hydrolase (beta-lactamase superfamily II)